MGWGRELVELLYLLVFCKYEECCNTTGYRAMYSNRASVELAIALAIELFALVLDYNVVVRSKCGL